jgi:hypothetical protein
MMAVLARVAHAIDSGAGKVAHVAGQVAKYAGMASAIPEAKIKY